MSYSCCSATPEKLDIQWLKNNSGKIFDTPNLVQDRIDMLNNRPVASCDQSCWQPESTGLTSRRLAMQTHVNTINQVQDNTPKELNVVLGSTCNMTCSYCCKHYSSAWARDLSSDNNYPDHENRYKLVASDKISLQLSHNEQASSQGFKIILDEIFKLGSVDTIMISGGEPFLYKEFPDLVNNLTANKSLTFYTGLGINHQRLKNQLKMIKNRDKLNVVVSAENCGSLYEFNRYSNTYDNFLHNLRLLEDFGFVPKFNSVVSNLTVHGIVEFSETFKNYEIYYQFCNDPDFLAVNVLDNETKNLLMNKLYLDQTHFENLIKQNLITPYSDKQKQNFKQYLNEFAKRRNLSLSIFPKSMLKWLET